MCPKMSSNIFLEEHLIITTLVELNDTFPFVHFQQLFIAELIHDSLMLCTVVPMSEMLRCRWPNTNWEQSDVRDVKMLMTRSQLRTCDQYNCVSCLGLVKCTSYNITQVTIFAFCFIHPHLGKIFMFNIKYKYELIELIVQSKLVETLE